MGHYYVFVNAAVESLGITRGAQYEETSDGLWDVDVSKPSARGRHKHEITSYLGVTRNQLSSN